ncbi:NUDIX domain-containing protein [Paractinoplanes brasiliensis]|uniref:Mutator protein MutT n=1 Tax=Paractinoplanes brasiliensis TaxID=52695 RepID=A0A4R6JMS9_9ACTN|nr:NUDIX domain-containing protein [Actinoplanes brasiliensis]TDO37640.1 mutator protein MutT [Actinoplanes brasiliensis]GID31790.1 DNA mismatch repair protein MutT [Actinoplanes brasiliensis]
MRPGHDFIGVGVGAMVFDDDGRVFLARRGPAARNERGLWEFPGGMVDFGETMADAVRREFAEEYGMTVEVTGLIGVSDHILPAEGQHWISPSFTARHIEGTPEIKEPSKCTEIGWFRLGELPEQLTQASRDTLRNYTPMG